MIITSTKNPRVKQMIDLRNRRDRDKTGLMRVEGYEELTLALESGQKPATLFYASELFSADQDKMLLKRIQRSEAELIEVTPEVFAKMAYRENPDGWLAAFPMPRWSLADLPLGNPPLVVVSEKVEKPGNLGAMLRTVDAAGVDALIAADPGTDWGNPNIVRASKGALFSVPVAAASTQETLDYLRQHQIHIVATTPDTDQLYTDVDLTGAVAVVVGEEKHGLSQQWLEAADLRVKIPMFGRVNSLNVSIATALLVYEVVRQRQQRSQTHH